MKILKSGALFSALTLMLVLLSQAAYSQPDYQKMGEKSRTAVEKAKKAVLDSAGPVRETLRKTEKVVDEAWKKSEPVRKEASAKVKTFLKETEPQRKAVIDTTTKYLNKAIRKSAEVAKEFKEGWDKNPKKQQKSVDL